MAKSTVANQGFTLLEVMIAVALVAVALVTLLGAQGRTISLAGISRFDHTASLLAEVRLVSLWLAGNQAEEGEGTAQVDGEDYQWQVRLEDVDGDLVPDRAVRESLQKVTVTVTSSSGQRFILVSLLARLPEEEQQ